MHQIYGIKYAPENETPLAHIVFSLKYNDLDLPFLKAVFKNIKLQEIIDFVAISPSSKYARKSGFLFEFLGDRLLDLSFSISGNN